MADGQMHIDAADKPKPTGLDLLREPFPPHQISKLPKPTKKQTDDLNAAMKNRDFSLGIRCKECGGWHHKDAIHLDYVGHAALTDRLLDSDPNWNWEPYDHPSLPKVEGGMWIKLTVCGVSRIGFGSADGKTGGDAIKEIIGDALRNAAMRFGAALDLWHKGPLHLPEGAPEQPEALPGDNDPPKEQPRTESRGTKSNSRDLFSRLQSGVRDCKTNAELMKFGKAFTDDFKKLPKDWEDEIRDEFTQRFLQTGIRECRSREALQKFGEKHADKFKSLSPARYDEVKKEYAQELEGFIAAEKQPENERG